MGQLIQHRAIHILNHNLAKIITGKKLTNPQSHNHSKESLWMQTVPETLSPVSDAALNLHRDPREREELKNRSALHFTWDYICLQQRIPSDEVRGSNRAE